MFFKPPSGGLTVISIGYSEISPLVIGAITAVFDVLKAADAGVAEPEMEVDLGMTSQDFNRKFKDSPVKRSKRRGYLRNLSVALGNTGDSRSKNALEKACLDDDPIIRQHAVWALEQIPKNQSLSKKIQNDHG